MIAIGDKKELIILIRHRGQRWYSLACFGRKHHYRKDGTCKHTDSVLAKIRHNMRYLVKVVPFGNAARSKEPTR